MAQQGLEEDGAYWEGVHDEKTRPHYIDPSLDDCLDYWQKAYYHGRSDVLTGRVK